MRHYPLCLAGLAVLLTAVPVVAAPPQTATTPSHATAFAPPLVVETDQAKTYTRQIVHLQWRDGDPVNIYVLKPKTLIEGEVKPPVCVYLYGYPQDAQRFLNDAYCERLTARGCAAVGFESALTGDRYHDRPMREWFVSELPQALADSAQDVHQILDYLSKRGDLDMTRVGMFGQGSGGAIAVLAAQTDPRLKALDLLDPWGDWPDWTKSSALVPETERPTYRTAAFLSRVSALDPVTLLPALENRRIRLIENDADRVTPAPCRERLASAAPPTALVLHYADNMKMFGVLSEGRLFDWMAKSLRTAPGQQK